MTRAELNIIYKNYHDLLTIKYKGGLTFKGKILSAEEFEKLHTLNYLNLEKQIVDNNLDEEIDDFRTSEELVTIIAVETKKVIKDISKNISNIIYNIENIQIKKSKE